MSTTCTNGPDGWVCSRAGGHSGPCALHETDTELQAWLDWFADYSKLHQDTTSVADSLIGSDLHRAFVAGRVGGQRSAAPVGGQADMIEQACDWKNGMLQDGETHEAFHFGNLCPYEVCAALLRGEPDPRRVIDKPYQPPYEHPSPVQTSDLPSGLTDEQLSRLQIKDRMPGPLKPFSDVSMAAPVGGQAEPSDADGCPHEGCGLWPGHGGDHYDDHPDVVVLCGSTRFKDAFHEQARRLTWEGYIVLTVNDLDLTPDARYSNVPIPDGVADPDELHRRKIDMADRVLVLDVGGYIGQSTRGEIEYATAIGKPIEYLSAAAAAVSTMPRGVECNCGPSAHRSECGR